MEANKEALKAIKDADNDDLPQDTKSFNKIKCDMQNGTRIWWYYQEDVEYAKDCGEEDIRAMAPFSGIVVSLPGEDYNGSIDERIVVVVDNEPCEKCYPEIAWVALNRLIDDDKLIEVFTK